MVIFDENKVVFDSQNDVKLLDDFDIYWLEELICICSNQKQPDFRQKLSWTPMSQLIDCHVKFSVNRIFRQAKLVRQNTLTTHVFYFKIHIMTKL
jgi:hypothetical protein